MQRRPLLVLTLSIVGLLAAGAPNSAARIADEPAGAKPALQPAGRDSCPVTGPPERPFTPPPPYDQLAAGPYSFWYGTDALWTAVPVDGVWSHLPHNPEGYTQKVFWWRTGYSWRSGDEEALAVRGWRVDAPALDLKVSRPTNAYAQDIGSAMLVGVDFPTLGCWAISGRYADAELTFVVWVER